MTAIKTLAELNISTRVRIWDCFTLKSVWKVGSQSRRWASSPKTHLLRAEKVIATGEGWKPNMYRIGSYLSVHAVCNGNGQHTGTVYDQLDTDAITCTKCLRRLEELVP